MNPSSNCLNSVAGSSDTPDMSCRIVPVAPPSADVDDGVGVLVFAERSACAAAAAAAAAADEVENGDGAEEDVGRNGVEAGESDDDGWL